jgi:hypothetical protein
MMLVSTACPPDCEHLDPAGRGVCDYCRKYRKRIRYSGYAKELIRLPRCILDEASNRLDRQADRDQSTSANGR